jgi:DNA-binding response OmpR family regulator
MTGIRIVVIDDEPDTLDLLKMYLEMMGYDVRTGLTGALGLKAIAAHSPQIVILDLMLPDMDGYEICETLRKQPETADLPVIMLSARTAREDVKRGYAAGATLYLKKPVDLHRLNMEAKRIVEVGRHVPPPPDDQEKHAAEPPRKVEPAAD